MKQIYTILSLSGMHHQILILILSVLVSAITQNASANDLGDDHLQLTGFGTVGLTNSGNDLLGFRRDISREGLFDNEWSFKPDTLIGLQLDSKFTDSLGATIQMVAKDRSESTFESSLEWAFLRYRYNPDLTIRAGRMGSDLFMLSEYRNVGFAYLWARPPVEFYGALALDSYDGVDFSYSNHLSDGLLQFKIFAGQSEQTFTSQIGSTDVKFNPIIGANLTWESANWRSRIVYQRSTFDSSIEPITPLVEGLSTIPSTVWPAAAGLASELETRDKVMQYYSLGVAYDNHPWVSQAEIGFIDSGSEATLPDTLTAYLSVARVFGPVTVYGVTAVARNTQDTLEVPAEPSGGTNPVLVALEQGTRLFADQTGIDQHSLSLGMRWDVRHDLALKLQWDRTWLEAYGTALWDQSGPVSQDQKVDTFSINFNFLF